jgi:hypothetical protein
MKTSALLLGAAVALLSLHPQTQAQDGQPDSMSVSRIVRVEPAMTPGSTMIFLPPHLDQPLLFSSPTFFFKDFLTSSVSPDFGRALEVHPDLLAPLRAQWEREAQLGTWRTILGSIQIGGVAYLAYRQFAKSGPMTIQSRTSKSKRK